MFCLVKFPFLGLFWCLIRKSDGQLIVSKLYTNNSIRDDFVCSTGKEYFSKSTNGVEQNVSLRCICHQTEIYMSFQAVKEIYLIFWDRSSCILFVHTNEKRSKCPVKYYSNSFTIWHLLLLGDVELNPGPCTALNSNVNEMPLNQTMSTSDNNSSSRF